MSDAAYNTTTQAEIIQQMLADQVPMVNWLVEYHEPLGFYIKANIMINSVPLNAGCYLTWEQYRGGKWLKRITYNLVHTIGDLIINSNRAK